MDQALFFQEPRLYNLQHKTCRSETSYFTFECDARRTVQIADESDHRSYEEFLSTREVEINVSAVFSLALLKNICC